MKIAAVEYPNPKIRSMFQITFNSFVSTKQKMPDALAVYQQSLTLLYVLLLQNYVCQKHNYSFLARVQ